MLTRAELLSLAAATTAAAAAALSTHPDGAAFTELLTASSLEVSLRIVHTGDHARVEVFNFKKLASKTLSPLQAAVTACVLGLTGLPPGLPRGVACADRLLANHAEEVCTEAQHSRHSQFTSG